MNEALLLPSLTPGDVGYSSAITALCESSSEMKARAAKVQISYKIKRKEEEEQTPCGESEFRAMMGAPCQGFATGIHYVYI
ncbi:unnamed protein product [Caretta caretta]